MTAAVERLTTTVFEVPADEPESDGTLEWDSTSIVVVEVEGAGATGLGYTYAPPAAAQVVEQQLREAVVGADALAPQATARALGAALRNAGRPGLGFEALSAVDLALWDLKARALGLPLCDLAGRVHDEVPVYGSGGFCSYPPGRVAEQLGGWVAGGIPRVKMKVGRRPDEDPQRIEAARAAVGPAELYVDANGAFTAKRALMWAERYAGEWGVTWFEEPVASSDLDGLRFVRERAPLEVAAGEYAYVPRDFVNLLGAVDCLQADVTRCGGVTGLMTVAALADAFGIDLSAHCAPAASVHPFAAVARFRHLEWFHDHVRVEQLLFDGVLEPRGGALHPDRSRPGNGLELKRADAERWAA